MAVSGRGRRRDVSRSYWLRRDGRRCRVSIGRSISPDVIGQVRVGSRYILVESQIYSLYYCPLMPTRQGTNFTQTPPRVEHFS